MVDVSAFLLKPGDGLPHPSISDPEIRTDAKVTKRPRFLKGPIPYEWLIRAGELPGESMKMAILIWHVSGLEKKRTGLPLPPRLWQDWYRNRKTFYRALERLEGAGLITVERRRGRSPVVSIVTMGERGVLLIPSCEKFGKEP